MVSTRSFWGSKVRQFRLHLGATVAPTERAALADWLTPTQLELFDRMHVADRRHGLAVVETLRADPAGAADTELLVAGLLHDAGKGQTGVWPRVAYSLGDRYGRWLWGVAGAFPGFGAPMARLRDHAELSAVLAADAGCTSRTVELIRHQADPVDPTAGRLLQHADDVN